MSLKFAELVGKAEASSSISSAGKLMGALGFRKSEILSNLEIYSGKETKARSRISCFNYSC